MADNAKSTKADAKTEQVDGIRYITIPVADNIDDATLEDLIRQVAPPVAGIVGNYADVQRGGAAVVHGTGSMSDGVQTPPFTDVSNGAAVAKAVDDAVDAAKTGRASSVGDSSTGAAIPGGTYNPPSPK